MLHFYILLTSVGIYLSFINIYDFKRNKVKLIIYFLFIYTALAISYKYLKISPLYGLNIINSILVYKLTKKTLLTITIPLMSTVLYITVNMTFYHIILFFTDINIYKMNNRIYLILYYLITYVFIVFIAKFLNEKFIKNIDEIGIFDKFKIQALIILTSILLSLINI